MSLPLNNLSLPVIAAPMFLISGPDLVIECCKNGIVGTFPALNQRSSEGFEEWLIYIKKSLDDFEQETGTKAAPFGVNLIVHNSNPRLQADLELCVKHKVPLIITSLGAVSEVVDAIHSYDGVIFHDVIKRRHAEKAAEAGVDGLILVCAGAGGHAGTLNPMPFISEVRSFFDKTIVLSGCISSGADVVSAIQMGADYAYMGTRFINTKESMADPEYQKMIIDSKTTDIVYTAAVSGVSANFMRPSLEAVGITEEMWGNSKKLDFSKRNNNDENEEAKAWKTVWSAGQGVTNIDDVLSVSELCELLKQESKQSLTNLQQNLKNYIWFY